MFHMFSKNTDPLEKVRRAQEKRDWLALARAYYDLGVACMDGGDQGSAMLWLSRADTVYSAADEIYSDADKKRLFRPNMVDDCSDRIGRLEEAPLLSNEVLAQVEEEIGNMEDAPVRVWSLLTLARLSGVGTKLAALPGCAVLGQLDRCVDLCVKSFQEPLTQEEFGFLQNVCSGLYELSDSVNFFAGGEVPCAGPAPLQVFDLNGMTTLLNIESLLDSQLRHLTGEGPDDDGALIPCALLTDYWQRTVGGGIRDLLQVQAELARIRDDCTFVRSGVTWRQVEERVERYKALDILRA